MVDDEEKGTRYGGVLRHYLYTAFHGVAHEAYSTVMHGCSTPAEPLISYSSHTPESRDDDVEVAEVN